MTILGMHEENMDHEDILASAATLQRNITCIIRSGVYGHAAEAKLRKALGRHSGLRWSWARSSCTYPFPDLRPWEVKAWFTENGRLREAVARKEACPVTHVRIGWMAACVHARQWMPDGTSLPVVFQNGNVTIDMEAA